MLTHTRTHSCREKVLNWRPPFSLAHVPIRLCPYYHLPSQKNQWIFKWVPILNYLESNCSWGRTCIQWQWIDLTSQNIRFLLDSGKEVGGCGNSSRDSSIVREFFFGSSLRRFLLWSLQSLSCHHRHWHRHHYYYYCYDSNLNRYEWTQKLFGSCIFSFHCCYWKFRYAHPTARCLFKNAFTPFIWTYTRIYSYLKGISTLEETEGVGSHNYVRI